jgi:tetratricopeptide (TPR) repeat protein
MERTVEEEKNLLDLIRTCQRNFVICVVKGRLTVEEDKARILINKLVEVDPSAKNYYLQGKLMMQMKYLSNAKQALQKSHELEPNEKTMSLLKSIREGKSEKEVCKYIINNLEAERIRESQQRKREAKDDWFNAAEREEEKKLIV